MVRASLLGAVLALGVSAPAFADEAEKRLIMVTHSSEEAIEALESNYDVGFIGDRTEAAVYLDAREEGILRAQGYQIGQVIEDESTWEARRAEIEEHDRQEAIAKYIAENGLPKSKRVNGQAVVNVPGETVIMRAYTFTNYAGRFLYVEAHNKANTNNSGPTLQLSYAGPDGEFRAPYNMSNSSISPDGGDAQIGGNKLVDAGQYMYHRALIALRGEDANLKAEDITVRVAASSGSFDVSDDVTEWANRELPPRVQNFQKDFITKYMNPTEVYERLDGLAEQFPDIMEVIPLPYDTNGYQRKAMAMMAGTTAPGSNPAAAAQNYAVQLFSKEWGHLGGNDITAEFRNPGTPNAPLSVSVTGKDIVVNLATNAEGETTSTARQVVDAINNDAAASALVSAYTYNNNAGAGIVPPREKVQLSDFLNGPDSIKGPFDQRVYRIGKDRSNTKVGVFIYCQQHAREWVTPITCVETAERLVKNYATDPTTKEYVDELNIFILPSVNPDGGHYSFFDNAAQRRNMTMHCIPGGTGGNVGNRNSWGVDLNRNSTVGSFFDGFSGGSSSCTSDTFSGPFEASEPEIKNELWIADTFPIKFAINVHTHGGYFMWSPGAYKTQGRETLPAPNIGIEKYFFEVADTILSHIKSSRNTVVLPQRTGPIADVLYSAAGNSADDQYYRKGIIAYSFEAGAQRMSVNQTTGAISKTNVGFQPCFAGPGTSGGTGSSCGTEANPNPLLVNEGHDSALEFAEGNYGLIQGALEYVKDTTPPETSIEYSAAKTGDGSPIHFRFTWDNEPSVIHYTMDGSTPTQESPTYNNQGPRRPGEVITLDRLGVHEIKWIAVDIKGNVSDVQSQTLIVGKDGDVGGTVPPTLSLSLGAPASFGAFVPGLTQEYTAATTANVISTAGDATLSVSDSGENPGYLVNGAFKLAQPLQASASSLAGTSTAGGAVSAAGTPLLTYDAPASNDNVDVTFKQQIAATDPLRTGNYGKTLTFTLSTTTP